MRRSTILTIGVTVGVIALGYGRVVRPWAKRWGATDEEVARVLPGDRIVHGRAYRATRAITIGARPEHVWPWLIQMGSGRAGWYAFDRIDNGGAPSARTIVPSLQRLEVGDLIPMAIGKDVGPTVLEMQPCRRMLWTTDDEFTWEWVLEPVDAGTRLISRIAERYPPLFSRRTLYAALASSGDVIMTVRMLRGIRQRAERFEASATATPGRSHEAKEVA